MAWVPGKQKQMASEEPQVDGQLLCLSVPHHPLSLGELFLFHANHVFGMGLPITVSYPIPWSQGWVYEPDSANQSPLFSRLQRWSRAGHVTQACLLVRTSSFQASHTFSSPVLPFRASGFPRPGKGLACSQIGLALRPECSFQQP